MNIHIVVKHWTFCWTRDYLSTVRARPSQMILGSVNYRHQWSQFLFWTKRCGKDPALAGVTMNMNHSPVSQPLLQLAGGGRSAKTPWPVWKYLYRECDDHNDLIICAVWLFASNLLSPALWKSNGVAAVQRQQAQSRCDCLSIKLMEDQKGLGHADVSIILNWTVSSWLNAWPGFYICNWAAARNYPVRARVTPCDCAISWLASHFIVQPAS